MGNLRQSQVQRMLQRLSPQQIQMIKLLELPALQLEQRIKREIEENPALEEDKSNLEESESKEIDIEEYRKTEEIPSYKLQTNNRSSNEKITSIPLSDTLTLTEYLNEQLSYLSLEPSELQLAQFLIGSLDSGGYLRRDTENLIDDLAFNLGVDVTEHEIEHIIEIIQSLEPAGVGARTLQEALLLQLRSLPQTKNVRYAKMVIADHFDEFARKRYDKIVAKLGITKHDFRSVISTIVNLSPKPANLYSEQLQSEPTIQVVPDFIVENENGSLQLSLNNHYGDVKLSKSYLDMLTSLIKESKQMDKECKKIQEDTKEATNFVRQKIESGKWFINAVKQRNATLLTTMNSIINFQREYFISGDETKLKPMILKDISDLTGLDISTISRVVNSKFVQTDFGIYKVKYFFSEAMKTTDGEEVSSREIKSILMECVENEDSKSPLTDEALMIILQERGYKIARRTVAKYREMLEIPVARMRKVY